MIHAVVNVQHVTLTGKVAQLARTLRIPEVRRSHRVQSADGMSVPREGVPVRVKGGPGNSTQVRVERQVGLTRLERAGQKRVKGAGTPIRGVLQVKVAEPAPGQHLAGIC